MTSNINFSAINEQYPIAGKDNDSQGFRDNFNYIKSGLGTAKSEIDALQSSALLTQNLVNGDPVNNNLNGSSINNGYYNNLHGVSYVATVNGTTSINVSTASIFVYTLTGNTTFTFTGWPPNTYYCKVKVHFVSADSLSHTASLYSTGGGAVHLDSQYTGSIPGNGKHQVIEAWSYNHGATVFVNFLGSF